MKKVYKDPKLSVVEYDMNDVLTSSTDSDTFDLGDGDKGVFDDGNW